MNYSGVRMDWQEFLKAKGSDIRKMYKWLSQQLEREERAMKEAKRGSQ